jgi:hypothetical protein
LCKEGEVEERRKREKMEDRQIQMMLLMSVNIVREHSTPPHN